jgi:cation transport ATPase
MKKLTLFFLIILATTELRASCIEVEVQGMFCNFCKKRISKTFRKIFNIEKINIILDKKVIQIHTKNGFELTENAIKQAVTEQGYQFLKLRRTCKFKEENI